MSTVPYVDLVLQHQTIKDDILKAIDKILSNGDFILGHEVSVFEEQLAKYCGTRFALGVNSGTDALFLALKAYDIGEGDEVIIPPNSFLATASAVIAARAKPVYVDIRSDLNIDPSLIEEKITKRTKAIIPVHLTGKAADMAPILKIAKKHRLKVFEDAAQAIGAEYKGQKVGSFGHVGCFSMHPLKTLNACGDGGAITLNDEKIYNKLKQLRNIGLKNRNESEIWGYNSRLDTIQAAILNIKLKYLDSWNDKRRFLAEIYSQGLKDIVAVPYENKYECQVYHTFVIQTPYRDELQKYLESHQIGSKIHYPIPIHMQPAAKRFGYAFGHFPVTEQSVQEVLSLPIHQDLEPEQVKHVIEKIHVFFKNKDRL
ncbi:MAG: dTDP-3-amino-3,4,6-trideoxy-alpha-D-glucose transaminase [Chlamydiae bacterium]|nr:dTDP-3-amino-3,4,6-trideoxy-alpha-D-glucose transaminase [Chlamydiota bacterium]